MNEQRARFRRPVPSPWASLCAALVLVLLVVAPALANQGPTKLYEPAVSPRTGTPTTTIVFEVLYRNREGSAPDHVSVVIDGVAHAMTGSGGTNWKAGARSTWSTKLAAGTHAISFEAADTRRFSDAVAAGTVTITAPTATPTPKPSATAVPTPTARPTTTPHPTSTPRPTSAPTPTPRPSGTPGPTATPGSTVTPGGTAIPDPTATPDRSGTPPPGGTGPGADPTSGPGPTPSPGASDAPGLEPAGNPDHAPSGTPRATGGPSLGWADGWGDGGGGRSTGASGSSTGPASASGSSGPSARSGPDDRSGSSTSDGGSTIGASGARPGSGGSDARGSGRSSSTRDVAEGGPGWGALASALQILGIDRPPALTALPMLAGTAAATTLAFAFAIFGKKRRDELPPAPDEVLHADAARADARVPGVAAAAAIPGPVDVEAGMPRWRRPSLIEARKADPARSSASAQMRMSFDPAATGASGAGDGRERR
ncbi:MAG: hypothetical protein QOF49_1147, partial [Chloroflexota bacterium]|nr:hypothetical protein [Chloroflexota bacterium]